MTPPGDSFLDRRAEIAKGKRGFMCKYESEKNEDGNKKSKSP